MCDNVGPCFKHLNYGSKTFHTQSFWKTQTSGISVADQHSSLSSTHRQEPRAVYRAQQAEKPETSTSATEDSVTLSEPHYKPINIVQDFRDLILKAT